MIYRLQYSQNGLKFRTILWSHGLRAAPSPETIYGLVPYGLAPLDQSIFPRPYMVSK